MSFTPRTFQEILNDMIAYVQSRTSLSDFTVGSIIRTVLEAAAFEDDEQYFQMVQLLDAFSYTTASGSDLDRRLADFGLARQSATAAFGLVRFKNNNVKTDQLSQDVTTGATTVYLFDSTSFPTSGYPYLVRLGEGTTRIQNVLVTLNDTATDTLTLDATTPLLADFSLGDIASVITGATPVTVNTGTEVQSPRTVSELARNFKTQEPATIPAGNLYSNEVVAKAVDPGTTGNVGVGRITKFVGSPPFSGAGVENLGSMSGGSKIELDVDFRERAVAQLQSMSRGTVLSLITNSVGVEVASTGQRVLSANVIEDQVEDEVVVYIDDGSGFVPDSILLPASSLAVALSGAETVLELADSEDFPSSGSLLIIDASGAPHELVSYESISGNLVTLTSGTAVSSAHLVDSLVYFVQVVTASAETGRRRFSLQNVPVIRSTDRIYSKSPLSSDWTTHVRDVDYKINRGTGEFTFISAGGLEAGTQLVANYSYYTQLAAEVQTVLEGDLDNAVEYPGVKAAGVFLSVEAPIIRRVTVRMTISAEKGFVEADLVPLVRNSVEAYINARKIGQDVIRSRLVDAAHDVSGVRDVVVTTPSSNITILENELPVPFDSSGNTLITIL